jgi:hypothetical protein
MSQQPWDWRTDMPPWVTTVVGRRLQRYIPWTTYAPGSMMRRIVGTLTQEFQLLRDAMTDAVNQTFARQATWTMQTQEQDWGLVPAPTLPIAQRQDRLVAQKRNLGTSTIQRIRSTATAFQFGDIQVVPDFAKYVIIIQFMGVRGVPANATDVQNQIRQRIPTAYDIQYVYRYTTYADIKRHPYTYGQLKALGLTYGQIKTTAM